MGRSLEAYRQGSNNTLPIEVTLEELVQGKYGVSQDAFFEKLGINPKIDTMQNIFTIAATEYPLDCTGNHPCLLLQLVCARHLSTRTSLLQTNPLMVCR